MSRLRMWLSFRLFRAANKLNPALMASIIHATATILTEDRPDAD